jgi:hypothetical protein
MMPEDNPVDPRLKKAFEEFKAVEPRNEKAARKTRSQYLAQIENVRDAVSDMGEPRLKNWKEILFFRRKENFSMAATITSIILLVTLILGGTGGTVFASQSSLPGDTLYPLKIATENMQEALTSNADAEMELQLQFANRRIEEIIAINNEGKVPPEAVLQKLHTRLQNAVKLASAHDGDEAKPALLRVREQLINQEQILLQLKAGGASAPVLLQTREVIQEQIRLVDTGLEVPLMKQEQLHLREQTNQELPSETPLATIEATEFIQGGGSQPNKNPAQTTTCTPVCIGTCTPNGSYGPGPLGTPQPGGNGQGGKP